MGLLRPATNQTAFLKAGILGFAGSGKTFTAKELAVGLAKLIGAKKVAFFDTETGSDFLIPAFNEAGIELLVLKSRSFADLKTFMAEAEAVGTVAIIDSVTHVWTDLVEGYRRRLNRRNGLRMDDWGPIKSEWGQFTNAYINAKCHAILCGRAGYEYEYQIDDETNKKELVKTGTKMKAEGEMSYEPSLLLEIERVNADATVERGKRSGWIHRCYVLKDRTNLMNGDTIDNPTFESFAPVIGFLNLGGEHVGVGASHRTSADLFDSPDSLYERKKQVEITLELIQNALIEGGIGGTGKAEKAAQVQQMKLAFGTSSWSAVQDMRLADMQKGLATLRISLRLDESPEQKEERESAAMVETLAKSVDAAAAAKKAPLALVQE
jgi:hypothetical protein